MMNVDIDAIRIEAMQLQIELPMAKHVQLGSFHMLPAAHLAALSLCAARLCFRLAPKKF